MREFVDGAEAIARGAIAARCNFLAGYPITPATPILHHPTEDRHDFKAKQISSHQAETEELRG